MKTTSIIISCLLFLVSEVPAQNPPTYSWRYYRPGNTGIQGDQATALWIDAYGDPYIAANTGGWGEGGFAKFSQSENKWINYSNVDYPILGSFDGGEEQIDEIIKDNENNLWMANNTGALRFNPQAGVSSIEKFGPTNSGLLGFTTDIDLAPDSTIWFISGGLVRFNPKNEQWTYWQEGNARIAVQPKTNGSYLVWSADTYFGYVFTYNSSTNQITTYMPSAFGDIAGLPGKDCVDDAGNFWALKMTQNGDWETLEYQRPDGIWIYPTPPYVNVSFYIEAFKAYGNGKAVMVLASGETWMFDGLTWNNFGTWRPGDFSLSIDADNQGNVWVCGIGGAAKRDAVTGNWQRYRITNTSQIDYFVEEFSLDSEGNVWLTGNAGTGIGGFQKFDGQRWTGFNQYTYGLGYPFPYDADNTQAIYRRPSNGDVIFNPTFHGIHGWNGVNYFALEDSMSVSKGFVEDSQGRLWSLGEYFNVRYYDENILDWIFVPLVGWGNNIKKDLILDGTIWASTSNQILRSNGVDNYIKIPDDFPELISTGGSFTTVLPDLYGTTWIGSTVGLIKLNTLSGTHEFLSPTNSSIPGEWVLPKVISPDGKMWFSFANSVTTESGLAWYDGINFGKFLAPPGNIPQWGGLPSDIIDNVEVREILDGYELWISCLGRGMAVLTVTGSVVPVELVSFAANRSRNNVNLNWSTATEINNSGFSIERKQVFSQQFSIGNEVWTDLAFINGNGTTTETKSYSYMDENLESGKYFYRLKQIDFDGTFEYSNEVEVEVNIANKFELSQNYPNPFNPSTIIQFNIPTAGNVKLIVYNLLGQNIKTLVSEFKESGTHSVNFDTAGLTSGVYIYKLESCGFTQTRKMILLK